MQTVAAFYQTPSFRVGRMSRKMLKAVVLQVLACAAVILPIEVVLLRDAADARNAGGCAGSSTGDSFAQVGWRGK